MDNSGASFTCTSQNATVSCQTDLSLPPHQNLDQLYTFGSRSVPADPGIVNNDHNYATCEEVMVQTDDPGSTQISDPSSKPTCDQPNYAESDDSNDQPPENIPVDSDHSYQPSDSDHSEHDPPETSSNVILEDTKFVTFMSQLDQLLKRCQECGSPILDRSHVAQGSSILVTGSCANYHDFQWSSSPKIGQMPASNLVLSAAILFSGGTFTTFHQAFDFMSMAVHSERTHHNIQSSYLFPVVHHAWQKQETQVLERSNTQTVINVIGDGRCDSPGFSAKYGTYTLMDASSTEILTFKVVQVTEAGSSVAMEKLGFMHCMDKLLENDVPIKTVATDQHPSITAVMGDGPKSEPRYKEIEHQFDVWHMSKAIKKRLRAAAKKKGCEKLELWIQSISNHLWWCASSCDGDSANLVDR